MRVAVLLLPLLALAAGCQSSGSIAEGDRLYRLQRYPEALQVYQDAASAAEPAPELEQRILETRYQVLAAGARRAVHHSAPDEALRFLEVADRLLPGHPQTAELRLRAQRLRAAELVERGEALLEVDESQAAERVFSEALSWDGESAEAKDGLERATYRTAVRQSQGERFYFLGVEELERGNDARALTALMHAETYWGKDSRAGDRLAQLTADLVAHSRLQVQVYLDADQWRQAWLALRDADRLQPGDPEVQVMLARVETELAAQDKIDAADLAMRRGDIGLAGSFLDQVDELAGGGRDDVLIMREAVLDEHNRQRYTLARACERDNQYARAAALYEEILAVAGEAGYEDVALRGKVAAERVAQAAQCYEAALSAQQAGDQALYKSKLAEAVRFASDYQDALERYRRS